MTVFARFCVCSEVMVERAATEPYAAEFICPANCGYGPVRLTHDQVFAESRPSEMEDVYAAVEAVKGVA